MADITQTGPVGLRGLPGLNRRQRYGDFAPYTNIKRNPNTVANSFTSAPTEYVGEELGRLGYGESQYDEGITSMSQAQNINEFRAAEQPWYDQLANGALKMVTTAATTFIDSTVGFLYGIGQGVYNLADDDPKTGFWRGMWDNAISIGMSDINDAMENYFKNYKSEWEQNASVFERMFSGQGAANFWGDDILKNAGFTIGAAGAIALTGNVGGFLKGLTSFGKAAQFLRLGTLGKEGLELNKAGKFVSWLTKTYVASQGEAAIESVNAINQNRKAVNANLELRAKQRIDDAEVERQLNLARGMSQYEADTLYNQRVQAINADVAKAKEQAEAEFQDAGNVIYAANILALSLSNNLTLGSMLRGGYDTSKSLLKQALKTSAGEPITSAKEAGKALLNGTLRFEAPKVGNVPAKVGGRWLLSATQEGLEEGVQNLASNAGQISSQARLNTWVKDNTMLGTMVNPNATEDLVSYTKAVTKAWEDQFGKLNSPGWTEVMAGFITGLLGFPSAHVNAKGQLRPTWEGGLKEQIEYFTGPTKEIQKQADLLNKALTDQKFGERVKHTVQQIAIRRGQDDALANDNVRAYKNLELQQLLSDAVFFRDMGMLDDYMAIYEALSEGIDEQDIAELRAASKDEKTGKSSLDGKTDADVKALYEEKAKSTLEKVKEALSNYEAIESKYGDRFSKETRDEALMEMSYLTLLQWDTFRRLSEVDEELEALSKKENKTAVEEARLKDLKEASKELQEQAISIREKANDYRMNPKKLQKAVEDAQLARQKRALYKKTEEAINKYKEASTLKDVVDVYFHSPEEDREAVLNQVISQTEGDTKNLLQSFKDFLNDVNSVYQLVDDKFKPDSLDNLALNKLFKDAFKVAVNEILSEESTTLSRQSLKEKLKERLKEWEDNALFQESFAQGVVIRDDGTIDFSAPAEAGVLYDNNFEEVLDNPDTNESHFEIIKGSQADQLREYAEKAKQWRDLMKYLNEFIDSLDKLDDLRKAAPKEEGKPKKKESKKEEKKGKKTTFTEEKIEDKEEPTPTEEEEEEPKAEEEEKKEEEIPDLLTKEEKKLYTQVEKKEKSGVTYHSFKKKGKVENKKAQEAMGKRLDKADIKLDFILTKFEHTRDKNKKKDVIKELLDFIKENVLNSDLIKEVEDFLAENKEYLTPDTAKGPSKPAHNNKDGQDIDDGASLKGNQHPAYVAAKLDDEKKMVRVTYQSSGKTPVQVVLANAGFKIQEIIDNHLYKVVEADANEENVEERTPIHYLHNNKLDIDDVVVLAVKASDVDGLIPLDEVKTTTINGEIYIPIGTLGYRAADKNTDKMYTSILEETQEEEHNDEGWAVNTKHTNRIKSITAGATVKQTLEDDEARIRDLQELLGLGKNPRNPNGLDIDDIGWTVVEGTEGYIKYRHIGVEEGKSYPLKGGLPGQVYMHIPASNGMSIPVYIEATFLNEIEESTILYEEIKRQIGIIADRESTMADRKSAIGRLRALVVFSKPNDIFLNEEDNKFDPNTVYITRNGQPIKVIDFKSDEGDADTLLEAIKTVNPRINHSITELERNPEIYLKSGALRTDIAYLGTVNAKFYIYPVNDNNELQENKVPTPKANKYDGSVSQREYLNGRYVYYDGTNFKDDHGKIIEDEDGTLQIAYDIKANKLKPIKYNDFVYYDVNGIMYTDNGHGGIVAVDEEYRKKVLEKGKKESKAKKAKKEIKKEVEKAEKKEKKEKSGPEEKKPKEKEKPEKKEKKNIGSNAGIDDVKTKEELDNESAKGLASVLAKRENEGKSDRLYDLVAEKFGVEADNDDELISTLIANKIDITSEDLDTIIDIVEHCR